MLSITCATNQPVGGPAASKVLGVAAGALLVFADVRVSRDEPSVLWAPNLAYWQPGVGYFVALVNPFPEDSIDANRTDRR